MNAKALGAFAADFIEGFLGGASPAAHSSEPVLPPVIPMDSIRQAVREVIQPLIDDEPPTAQGLDLFTDAMGRDDLGAATAARVEEINAREEQRAREAATTYHPDMPEAKTWMAPETSSA